VIVIGSRICGYKQKATENFKITKVVDPLEGSFGPDFFPESVYEFSVENKSEFAKDATQILLVLLLDLGVDRLHKIT
jgi:hypothetical protein